MSEDISFEQKRQFLVDFDDVYNAARSAKSCPAYVGNRLMLFVHKWQGHNKLYALANSVLDAACASTDFSKIRFLIGMYHVGFRIDFGDKNL